MNSLDFMLAFGQLLFFMISLCGFISLLFIIILGWAKLDDSSEKLAYTMLGVLGTIVTQQAGYFYQRIRRAALPDPDGLVLPAPPTKAPPLPPSVQ